MKCRLHIVQRKRRALLSGSFRVFYNIKLNNVIPFLVFVRFKTPIFYAVEHFPF